MFQMHIAPGPEHFEFGVVRQESLEQVLFVPKTVIAKHPILRVLCGKENVMTMDQDTWLQTRKNFKILVLDIATDGQYVARIYE
jgi:hypothetical protein